jgi:hypothetical protein
MEFQCEYNDEYLGPLKVRAFLQNLYNNELLEYFVLWTSLWCLLLRITHLCN